MSEEMKSDWSKLLGLFFIVTGVVLVVWTVAFNCRVASTAPFDQGYEEAVTPGDHPIKTWKKK